MATQEDGTELDPDKVVPDNDFNAKKEKSTGKKGGPKSLCTTEMLDDLVDIIVSNERYKRKLIFTNCPTTSNAIVYQEILKEMQRRCSQRGCTFDLTLAQTRNKFKKNDEHLQNCLDDCQDCKWNQKVPRPEGVRPMVQSIAATHEVQSILPT